MPGRRARSIPGWVLLFAVKLMESFSNKTNVSVYSPDRLRALMDMSTISNEKAQKVLGWEPKVSLEEGMGNTKAWFYKEGYL